MFSRYWLRITLSSLLSLAITASGFGQPPVIPPVKSPSNTGAIIWVVVSFALGGFVIYALHSHKGTGTANNQPSFVGCTELSDNSIILTDEKDNQPYVILPGSIALKPGERVEVLGKKDEDDMGRIGLQVAKLVKDYGACRSTKVIDVQ